MSDSWQSRKSLIHWTWVSSPLTTVRTVNNNGCLNWNTRDQLMEGAQFMCRTHIDTICHISFTCQISKAVHCWHLSLSHYQVAGKWSVFHHTLWSSRVRTISITSVELLPGHKHTLCTSFRIPCEKWQDTQTVAEDTRRAKWATPFNRLTGWSTSVGKRQ